MATRRGEQPWRPNALVGSFLRFLWGYACNDADGRITFFNKRAVELWGANQSLTIIGKSFAPATKVFLADGTFVPPDHTPMAGAIRDGKSFSNVEAIVERPDGSKFMALVNIDVLRDENRVLLGAINVFQDITNFEAFC